MNMPIKPGFGVRGGISADVAGIAVRQIKGKEVSLLLHPTNDDQRLSKIRLPMPGGMAQGDKHLLAGSLLAANVVFDDRVATIKSTFVSQPLKYPLCGVALLAWARLILRKPAINGGDEWIKLGPTDRCCPSIARRFRIRQHLSDTIPADPKILRNLTPTQPVLKMSVTNLQIQIHGVIPQTL